MDTSTATPQQQPDQSNPLAVSTMPDDTTATIPQQQPDNTPPPMPEQQQTYAPRSGLAGIVDAVRNAIAPQHTTETIDPDTGQRTVTPVNESRGQMWRDIGREALQGATTGLAQGKGAGNMGRGIAAAVGQQEEEQEKEKTQEDQQAEADYQRLRQAKLDKANSQLLQTQIASNEWALARNKVKAGEEDISFANQQEDREKNLGSQDLGVYPDHTSLADIRKLRPQFWKDHYEDNSIVAIPSYGADGERQGIHVYLRQPGIGDQLAPEGTGAYRFVGPEKPGEPAHLETFTPSGRHTEREYDTWNQAALGQYQKWQSDQLGQQKTSAEIGETKASTTEKYAAASKDRAEAAASSAGSSPADIGTLAAGLVEGTMDPSQLSKRSKDYDAKLEAANQYSLQKYGRPFDIAKAQADYKYATNVQTFNTLNYLDSLIGRNNDGGNLAALVKQSDNLRQGNFPAINDAEQWAKLEAGNPQVAAYYGTLTEVSDQIAKILQGGGTGSGSSDAKLRQAQELLQKGFNKDQMRAVANDSLRPMLANRKAGIIGDNRYLQRWHPAVTAPPPGATAAVHNKTGQLTGWVVGNKFVPAPQQPVQ